MLPRATETAVAGQIWPAGRYLPTLVLEWVDDLKPSGAAYWRLKANREENLTKYAGSIYANVKKPEKIGKWWKKWRQAEKARFVSNRPWKTILLSNCECLILMSNMFHSLYLYLHETWSSFISSSCKRIWGVESAAFLWPVWGSTSPRYAAALNTSFLSFYCTNMFSCVQYGFIWNYWMGPCMWLLNTDILVGNAARQWHSQREATYNFMLCEKQHE